MFYVFKMFCNILLTYCVFVVTKWSLFYSILFYSYFSIKKTNKCDSFDAQNSKMEETISRVYYEKAMLYFLIVDTFLHFGYLFVR